MIKPYPDYAARQYPPGKKPDRRRITKCSDPSAWYASMLGQIITVHYFCTFGAWDIQGRWLWYYDLSGPVNGQFSRKDINRLMKIEHERINEARAYMNKWNDIPFSMQMESLSNILGIENNDSSHAFCIGLIIRPASESAKILFDSRGYEFTESPVKKSWFKKLFK